MKALLFTVTLFALLSAPVMDAGTKKICHVSKFLSEQVHYDKKSHNYVVDKVYTRESHGKPGWEKAESNLYIIVYDTHITVETQLKHEYTLIIAETRVDSTGPNNQGYSGSAVDEEGILCGVTVGSFMDGTLDEFGDKNYRYFRAVYANTLWCWQIDISFEEPSDEWQLSH